MRGKSYKKGGFKAFLSEKLEWYDAIYQDVERNGYRRSDSIENNVEVALAANGDLLLIDGRHRLILAQLLGLKKIPVVFNLVAEIVARSLLGCSDHSTARPYEESKRTTGAQWMSCHHLPLAVAKLLGLKNNMGPSIISMGLGQRCR